MDELIKLVKGFAPVLGDAIAGPLGGAALGFLANKLGAPDSTVESIKTALAGVTPEQQIKLKELDIQYQQMMIEESQKLPLAQIAVNQEEAKSESKFISGGRPFLIWVCGFAFLYAAILEPLMRFVAKVYFSYTGAFPMIDTTLTMQVLFGLLGLGGMRTFEKFKGVQGNH